MKDQRTHWNNAHQNQWLHAHSQHQTDFAETVNKTLDAHSKILELGCGEGNDSFYFAQQGHDVTATDFSDVVTKQNQQRYAHASLRFLEQDISQPLVFSNDFFDVVYARLSLHYFTNKTTVDIFKEIKRVLKPGGALYFMCKSTDDTLYGQGEKIEPDMFELKGHVRHFFSEPYVVRLLNEAGLTFANAVTGQEVIYDNPSGFIKVIATKN